MQFCLHYLVFQLIKGLWCEMLKNEAKNGLFPQSNGWNDYINVINMNYAISTRRNCWEVQEEVYSLFDLFQSTFSRRWFLIQHPAVPCHGGLAVELALHCQ